MIKSSVANGLWSDTGGVLTKVNGAQAVPQALVTPTPVTRKVKPPASNVFDDAFYRDIQKQVNDLVQGQKADTPAPRR